MKKSELLRKAKKRIESLKSAYICAAVESVVHAQTKAQANWQPWREAAEITHWIDGLLNADAPKHYCRIHTYEDWAALHLGACPSRTEARITRLAWIDWMIKYWKERGQ